MKPDFKIDNGRVKFTDGEERPATEVEMTLWFRLAEAKAESIVASYSYEEMAEMALFIFCVGEGASQETAVFLKDCLKEGGFRGNVLLTHPDNKVATFSRDALKQLVKEALE